MALAAALNVAAAASAAELAGTVERLKGAALRINGNATAALNEGAEVYVDDVIDTGADAPLVIRFADASSRTLGGAARVRIDDLVFGGTAEPKQSLAYFEGVFQFVSGRIAQSRPEAVAFDTGVATIGIRGTDFLGGELTVGMPPGTSHIGFPIREGAIAVTNAFGSVTLDEPGEGTFIPLSGQAAPTPVRQWTSAEAAEAEDLLAF
ncbi:MAG: hypothetical protein VW405_04575 [Rhodospirillaceae bacterium]